MGILIYLFLQYHYLQNSIESFAIKIYNESIRRGKIYEK